MADIQSRPYRPDPGKCCEGCVFGGFDHEPWCADSARFDCSGATAVLGEQLAATILNSARKLSESRTAQAMGQLKLRDYYSTYGPALSLPAENPHGPATKTGVVVCRHGNVEVCCPICGSEGRKAMQRMYDLEFGGTKDSGSRIPLVFVSGGGIGTLDDR